MKPKKLIRPPRASAARSADGRRVGRGGLAQCAAPQLAPQPTSTSSGTSSFSAGSAALRHHLADHRGGGFLLALGHFEHQLVMDLQQHSDVAEAGIGQRRVHPVHRPLDQVGAGALDRRIDRGALGPGAETRVGRADIGEMGLPPEQGAGEAMLADEGQRLVDIGADAGETGEIAVDDRLALILRHAQPPGQAPARNAVEDGEIDRLGLAARVAVDRAEQFLGGHRVDVRRPC